MLSEPMIFYKLMNPYMSKQVNFPLTNPQLPDFFLEHEYATYFTLQQALNELLRTGLIHTESNRNISRYEITKEGEDTLPFFGKNISPAIIDDMDRYLKEGRFRVRDEIGIVTDCYRPTSRDCIVRCEVREGKTVLIGLSLSVPDREQTESMYSNWKRKSQEIYAFTTKALMNDQ